MRSFVLAAAALALAACATPSGTQQPRKYPTDPRATRKCPAITSTISSVDIPRFCTKR